MRFYALSVVLAALCLSQADGLFTLVDKVTLGMNRLREWKSHVDSSRNDVVEYYKSTVARANGRITTHLQELDPIFVAAQQEGKDASQCGRALLKAARDEHIQEVRRCFRINTPNFESVSVQLGDLLEEGDKFLMEFEEVKRNCYGSSMIACEQVGRAPYLLAVETWTLRAGFSLFQKMLNWMWTPAAKQTITRCTQSSFTRLERKIKDFRSTAQQCIANLPATELTSR